MTVTVLSEVLALTTGRVPCFFSLSFKGRTRMTTCTDDVAAGDGGRGTAPPRRDDEEDDVVDDPLPLEVEENDVEIEGETILVD